jgi:hypothetical protein
VDLCQTSKGKSTRETQNARFRLFLVNKYYELLAMGLGFLSFPYVEWPIRLAKGQQGGIPKRARGRSALQTACLHHLAAFPWKQRFAVWLLLLAAHLFQPSLVQPVRPHSFAPSWIHIRTIYINCLRFWLVLLVLWDILYSQNKLGNKNSTDVKSKVHRSDR